MRFIGFTCLLVGGLFMLGGVMMMTRWRASDIVAGIFAIIQSFPALILGEFTLSAAAAFRRIVRGHEDTRKHLVEALEKLRNVYKLQVVLTVLGIIIVILALVLLVAVSPLRAPT
jgi:hypothetical protein